MKSIKLKDPMDQIAVIREEECIGCTKCIKACPVDAIIGAAKKMHSILMDRCTGCELCIPPCPVDCIDLQAIPERDNQTKQHFANQSQQRNHQQQQRLSKQQKSQKNDYEHAKQAYKDYIAAAIARVKQKKDAQS